MILRLFLLFTIVPALELFLLLQLGAWLGPLQTFLIVVVTGMVGAWLAKREGLGVLSQLSEELRSGLPPGSRLAEGALVLAGGLLLVTPGVLTDLTGFLFIFPVSRRWLAPHVVRAVASRLDIAMVGPGVQSAPSAEPGDPRVRIRTGPPPQRAAAEKPFSSPFDDLP